MTDKQLTILYTIVLICWVGSFALLHQLLKPPTSAEGYADKLCQELYGPHTQYDWSDKGLQCLTARGELLPVRMK